MAKSLRACEGAHCIRKIGIRVHLSFRFFRRIHVVLPPSRVSPDLGEVKAIWVNETTSFLPQRQGLSVMLEVLKSVDAVIPINLSIKGLKRYISLQMYFPNHQRFRYALEVVEILHTTARYFTAACSSHFHNRPSSDGMYLFPYLSQKIPYMCHLVDQVPRRQQAAKSLLRRQRPLQPALPQEEILGC